MTNFLKYIARSVFFVMLVVFIFGCTILLESCRNKAKGIKLIETNLSCNPTSDTLNYVKEKIKKLLTEAHQITLSSREQELECVKILMPGADFLIIESTENGENYHTIEQYLSREIKRSFVIDTIKTEAKKGKLYFKIQGKSTVVEQNESEEEVKVDEIKIPVAFQGKIRGNTRRINIISQKTANNIVEFSYAVLGSYSEKNKKGNINFTNNEAFFETLGKGKIVQKNNEITIKFESSNTEIISINQ